MCKKSWWHTSACNMTGKKSTQKIEKSCKRWHVCLIFGPISSFSRHVAFSYECRITQNLNNNSSSVEIDPCTHTYWVVAEDVGNSIDGKADSCQFSLPQKYDKPNHSSKFGICPLNMPGANKHYFWPYLYQENKMQYLIIKIMKNKGHNTVGRE